MNDDIFAVLRKYAEDKGIDADRLDTVLTTVADAEHIALKLSDAARITESETRRTILDITQVEFENVKATGRRVIPVEKGVTGLFGPNDSGKTTAAMAARWLIGGAKAVGQGLDEKLIRAGKEEMSGALTFAGDHERFIKRSVSRRVVKKGKDAGQVKVERTCLVKLNGHTEDKLAKAQAEVETYLGGDPAFVLSLAFLEQGQVTAMLDADPAQRKAAVFKLLGLHAAEETAKKLRAVQKKWQDDRDAALAARAQQATEREQLLAKLSSYPVQQLEEEVKRLAPVATAADATVATQRGTIQRRLAEIADDVVMKMEVSHAPVDQVSAREQVAAADKALMDAHDRVKLLREKYKEIHALPGTCHVCAAAGKTCEISPEWKVQELAKIQSTGKEIAGSILELEKTAKDRRATLNDLDNLESIRKQRLERQKLLGLERERLNEQLAQLPAGATPDPSAVEAYAWAQQKLKEANDLSERCIRLKFAVDKTDGDAGLLDVGLTGAQEREALAQAVEAFGKDGIPMWCARGHIGRVNQLAREMGAGDRYTFSFGSELEVVIHDTRQDMVSIAPPLASGSSRERGALILAAAMSRYQQELAGIHCPLLWIDELPFQDEVNAQAVAATVKRLATWFDRVVFAASDWHLFEGQFDHEVFLKNELLEQQVEAQRAAGSIPLAATAAEIKKYTGKETTEEQPKGHYTKMVEQMATKALEKPAGDLKSEIDALAAKLEISKDPGF